MERNDVLRRYTGLPALIDILVRRRLTLLSFRHWVDSNDRRALQLYQDALHYRFVGAMCLTQAPETFHHWHIFAGGDAGVCVVFDRRRLDALFSARPHFIAAPVQYVQLNEIERVDAADIHRLPFLKRYGFRDEREFRLLGYAVEAVPSMSVEIEPAIIRRVILSPFAHPSLVESTRIALRAIPGWFDLDVRHSSLTDNQSWQTALSGFVDRHGIVYGDWVSTEIEFNDPVDGGAELT